MGAGLRVLAVGTFDLFHHGHVEFLRNCKSGNNHLIVALNTDAFAARYKRTPILSLRERGRLVEACRFVDQVLTNEDGEDCRPLVLRAKPQLIAHGDDWTGESLMKQMGLDEAFLEERGVEFRYYPYSSGISSTEIERRVRSRSPLMWM